MRERTVLFLKLIIILFGCSSTMSHCDMSTTLMVEEGNMGQSPDLNWLGVLRVHLHDGDSIQIAVSGIVLIKEKHALANANDVSKIPLHVFKTDTQAMFIANGDTPWYVAPSSYVVHPEYEYYTYNSIAIVTLDIDEGNDFPLNPICFPTVMYNTSNYLYLTGYTDTNKLLEKVIYKIQYLPKTACEEFYDRAGLTDKMHLPNTYLCGYSPYNGTHCVWDTGMALVSNATGWFALIGFGVQGPGCAAPARFIDLFPYFTWIDSVTNEGEMYDSPDYRRQDSIEFVPAHDLFLSNTNRRQFEMPSATWDHKTGYQPYEYRRMKTRKFTIEPYYDRSLVIFPFFNTLEMYENSCLNDTVLLYREIFKINFGKFGNSGSGTYKFSLFNLPRSCACVRVIVSPPSAAFLSFREAPDYNGTGVDGNYDDLPQSEESTDELFKYFKQPERPMPKGSAQRRTSDLLTEDTRRLSLPFVHEISSDLYIRFNFYRSFVLKFAMYGSLQHDDDKIPERRAETVVTPTPTQQSVHRRKSYKRVKMLRVKVPRVKLPMVKMPRVKLPSVKVPTVKEPSVIVSTDTSEDEVVRENVNQGNQGCRKEASLVLVMEHFVLSLTLRRVFFVN